MEMSDLTDSFEPRPSERLRKAAVAGQLAAILGAVAVPLGAAAIWISPAWFGASLVPEVLTPEDVARLPASVRAIGFLISLLPVLICVYGLLQGRAFFAAFANGQTLNEENARRLFRIASVVLALAATKPLIKAILSIVLTWQNPVGQRHLVLSFSLDDYLLVIIGGLVLAVSWVMGEATRIAEDHSKIV